MKNRKTTAREWDERTPRRPVEPTLLAFAWVALHLAACASRPATGGSTPEASEGQAVGTSETETETDDAIVVVNTETPEALLRRVVPGPLVAPGTSVEGACRFEVYESRVDPGEAMPDGEESERWGSEGYEEYVFDAEGRPYIISWNSDAAGLSGELRDTFGTNGDREGTVNTPYETISGDEPTPDSYSYTYQREGDTVRVVTVGGDADGRAYAYRFDAQGRVVERHDEEAESVHTCSYDQAGRVSEIGYRGRRGASRMRLLYEGDRIISERREVEDGWLDLGVWDLGGAFFVLDDEYSMRVYGGSCTSTYLRPCSPEFAPMPPGRDTRAVLPTVTIGRPRTELNAR